MSLVGCTIFKRGGSFDSFDSVRNEAESLRCVLVAVAMVSLLLESAAQTGVQTMPSRPSRPSADTHEAEAIDLNARGEPADRRLQPAIPTLGSA